MKPVLKYCFSSLVLFCLYLTATQIASSPTKRFDLDASTKLVCQSDPDISPGGKSIVVAVAGANYEDNRWENELQMVDVATGVQRALTSRRHVVTQPRWSPSGDRLAFISNAATGKENKPQIFMLAMNGGEANRNERQQ